jgi:outer membrane protein OmpA-like peptidoglycan-associated protein
MNWRLCGKWRARADRRRQRCLPALAAGAGFAAAALAPAAVGAAERIGGLLDATPLILKDGRIARVSVHTVPFVEGESAMSARTALQLAAFTKSIATDCFLTAQVIGHVGKDEQEGRETLDTHRLARARADAIQASLIGNGLPASSIASVWDWQFIVADERATLWVFRLTAGEDCDDAPLAGMTVADSEAGADSGASAAAPAEATEAGALSDPLRSIVSAVAAEGAAGGNGGSGEAGARTAPVPSPPRTPPTQTAASEAKPGPKATPLPAVAARDEAPAERVTRPAALQKKASPGGDAAGGVEPLEIVFATNSSYFPLGSQKQLQAFADQLAPGASYALRIRTSVDDSQDVSGATSPEEATRYNRWLATRRFERVRDWLQANAEGRELAIEPVLVEDDPSRKVVIELEAGG